MDVFLPESRFLVDSAAFCNVTTDNKPSKAEILRGDNLTQEHRGVFAVVQRTVAGYKEEAAGAT